MKRRLALFPAALLLAATLTSCAGDDGGSEPTATPEPDNNTDWTPISECLAPGAVSDTVTVEGEFGEDVSLASEAPIEVDTLEVSVLDGDGSNEIASDDDVIVVQTIFNGATGDRIQTTSEVVSKQNEMYADWVAAPLQCAGLGDRVVTVVPASEVLGAGNVSGSGIPDLGEDDALVIVSDYTSKLLDQAEGTELELPADLPQVEVADTGEPTITIPSSADAPASLTVQTMVEGEGREVQAGDMVYVHYRGVIWSTGEEFDSSWSRGEHTSFNAAVQEEVADLGRYVPTPVIGGFRDALVGQTVGSRVLSIVPAEDGGYGGDNLVSMGHAEDAVMVFVLDILGAAPAPLL